MRVARVVVSKQKIFLEQRLQSNLSWLTEKHNRDYRPKNPIFFYTYIATPTPAIIEWNSASSPRFLSRTVSNLLGYISSIIAYFDILVFLYSIETM